ncbi:2-amino-4-hydroxy-6-hydroxymethyldihydropteridine diphosphokinase [Anaerobacillus isosaccharinicus]|uniref:2-amino-4-hydroxy-6-hydroxymethyldihydropteridine diphosphokinase n=1 Tax=Anaerobacillus isosaccharinicus TaxID=1532552 RepID=A0A7S7RCX3_9BACI|nr:2-amino-4-hydroxy-6-hydroxymethyldihydropteridine diphosphokinase [Anaerobacillus isosaccharinicus]MBA5584099.1 2-amino-4-hydroxy-6-hydroxymethyldihydropteridine diphosphokinase [Anaerobacillus isosaccharinicus]QOY37489.1 2-amino-4-hydroxy-6-hydroxymethyldihydropteridine diphosphokinase [Anaerobacillus isosaccharinicus]
MDNGNTVFISLGSNMGNRLEFLKFGVKCLDENVNISIKRYSSIYETAPVGLLDQADFFNMVVEIETFLTPLELLKYTQEVQKKAGRKFNIRWGPRTLDLDILMYNQENIEMDVLTVPHPRMYERGFVIIPLREIAPSLYFSSVKKTIQQVYQELLDKEGVRLWKNPFGEEELGHFEN